MKNTKRALLIISISLTTITSTSAIALERYFAFRDWFVSPVTSDELDAVAFKFVFNEEKQVAVYGLLCNKAEAKIGISIQFLDEALRAKVSSEKFLILSHTSSELPPLRLYLPAGKEDWAIPGTEKRDMFVADISSFDAHMLPFITDGKQSAVVSANGFFAAVDRVNSLNEPSALIIKNAISGKNFSSVTSQQFISNCTKNK